eukprot:COSAG02_NODE_13620_length_1371_cov_1.460692_1_plen_321_part_10
MMNEVTGYEPGRTTAEFAALGLECGSGDVATPAPEPVDTGLMTQYVIDAATSALPGDCSGAPEGEDLCERVGVPTSRVSLCQAHFNVVLVGMLRAMISEVAMYEPGRTTSDFEALGIECGGDSGPLPPASEPPAEEPVTEPEVTQDAEPNSEPDVQPAAEPEITQDAEPASEPDVQPAAKPEITQDDEPATEPDVQPAAEPEITQDDEPAAEPVTEPGDTPGGESNTEQDFEPIAAPESQPASEPNPVLNPTPEPSGSENPNVPTRTCADTDADGALDNFDCSGSANRLHSTPGAVACAGETCTAGEYYLRSYVHDSLQVK